MKKKIALFPMVMLFFIMGSCQQINVINYAEEASNKTTARTSPKILFFYSQQTMDKEDPYYDALFEITDDYPEHNIEIQFLLFDEHNEMTERYEILECPTMIIKHGDQVALRIAGNHESSYIYKEIATILDQEELAMTSKQP